MHTDVRPAVVGIDDTGNEMMVTLQSNCFIPFTPRRRFRIYAGEIFFDPIFESSGDTYVVEYYSDGWCESSGGTAQTTWLADTDVPLLPDDCFILGLIWRFKRVKGLDYGEEFRTWNRECEREIGRAGMAPIVDLTGDRVGTRFLDEDNIPDTFPDLI